jgi:hypothetical protein
LEFVQIEGVPIAHERPVDDRPPRAFDHAIPSVDHSSGDV